MMDTSDSFGEYWLFCHPLSDPAEPNYYNASMMYLRGQDKKFWDWMANPKYQKEAIELRQNNLSEVPAWVGALMEKFPNLLTFTSKHEVPSWTRGTRFDRWSKYYNIHTDFSDIYLKSKNTNEDVYTTDLRSSQKHILVETTKPTTCELQYDQFFIGIHSLDELGTIQIVSTVYDTIRLVFKIGYTEYAAVPHDSRKKALDSARADALLNMFASSTPDASPSANISKVACFTQRIHLTTNRIPIVQNGERTYYTISEAPPLCLFKTARTDPAANKIRFLMVMKYILGVVPSRIGVCPLTSQQVEARVYSFNNHTFDLYKEQPRMPNFEFQGLNPEDIEYIMNLKVPKECLIRLCEVQTALRS
jgi:hypothetical protein